MNLCRNLLSWVEIKGWQCSLLYQIIFLASYIEKNRFEDYWKAAKLPNINCIVRFEKKLVRQYAKQAAIELVSNGADCVKFRPNICELELSPGLPTTASIASYKSNWQYDHHRR